MTVSLPKRMLSFIIRNPWIPFVVGFLIRIALLPLDYSFDVNSHMEWGKEAVLYGLKGFYERKTMMRFGSVYPNYPPFAIYLFAIGYYIHQAAYGAAWYLNTHISAFPSGVMKYFDIHLVYAMIEKVPAVIADLGIGYLCYRTAARMNKRPSYAPIVSASLVLLNPVFFYNSALWGQIDSIPIFFVMLAFYWLYSGSMLLSVLSGAAIALALLSKQTAIILLPLYIIVVAKRGTFADTARTLFVGLIMFWLMFLPFSQGSLISYAFPTYLSKMVLAPGLPYASNHAFNTWAVITGWKDIRDTVSFGGIGYVYWGYAVAALLLLLPYMKLLSLKKIHENHVYAIGFITCYAVFLFFTKMHERHLLMAIALLIPVSVFSLRERYVFVVLSVLHALNLYHNWSVPRIEPVVRFLVSTRVSVTLSAIMLMVFCWYYPRFLRGFLREK